MKKFFTIFSVILLFAGITANAQVKIGLPSGVPAASAILDLSNTDAAATAKKGFLGPQVALSGTADATTVPSPATGLMVYNTTAAGSGTTAVVAGYYYFNSTQWVQMVSSAAPASGNIYTADGTLSGNRTVTMGANTLGFVGNNVGIGTASPTYPLHLVGQSFGIDNTAAGTASFAELKSGPAGSPLTVRLQSNVTGGLVGTSTNHDFQIYANGSPRITAAAAGNVGIGATAPNSSLQVSGSTAFGYSELAASATLNGSNHFVNVNSSSATTITLPAITGILGREYIIRNTGTGTVSVVVSGGSIINAGTNSFATLTATAGQTYTLYAGSSNWQALLNVTNINTSGGAATLQSLILPATIQGIAGGTPGTAIPMGGAGTAVNITFDKSASNYANSISGADFNASNSQITLPAGIYQVIWNFVGIINFPANPSSLSLFWDVPDGTAGTHRVHYASGNSTSFNPYGLTFVTTMQITATRTFNFSLGAGSGNASTTFAVGSDARLAFVKIQ